jgi:hypothetical protein
MSRENFKFSCHLKFIKEIKKRQEELREEAMKIKILFDGLKEARKMNIGKMSC